MPQWAWALLAAATVVGVSAAAGVFLWRRQMRRWVLGLVSRAEGTRAGYQTLSRVAARLAEADDDALRAFASDPSHLDRRALAEVAVRTAIARDELATMALPRRLLPAGEALAAAAAVVAEESGRVREGAGLEETLDALARIDLVALRDSIAEGEARLRAVCADVGVEETAVYGGGLYI